MFTKEQAYHALQEYIESATFVDEKTDFPLLNTSAGLRMSIAEIVHTAEASPLMELFDKRYEELKHAPKDQILMELVMFMNEDQRKELLQNKKFVDFHDRIKNVEKRGLSLLKDFRNLYANSSASVSHADDTPTGFASIESATAPESSGAEVLTRRFSK